MGLEHFDDWAATFAEKIAKLEVDLTGQGYRTRERLANFVNIPELMSLYHQTADIKTARDLNLPVPELTGGKPITVAVEPTEEQRDLFAAILNANEALHANRDLDGQPIDPHFYNMLCLTSDGKLGALDPRCLNLEKLQTFSDIPLTANKPSNKVLTLVDNVSRIYNETSGNKSTQLIFCDKSTPHAKGAGQLNESDFNVYDDVKERLIEKGVPAGEIAFIHDAKTDKQKDELFAKVRSGKIRVLMGSTDKMGEGTNVQDRLIALHHLDCPWRPSDLEQRNGRIIRRGNLNPEVQVYQYVTKRTFDSYSWQTVQTKQRFIAQVFTGEITARRMDNMDEESLNYAEVTAIATDNPLIKRKFELENEISELRIEKKAYQNERYAMQDNLSGLYPAKIAALTGIVQGCGQDVKLRNANWGDFHLRLKNETFTDKTEAGDRLIKAATSGRNAGTVIGEYKGFRIEALPRLSLEHPAQIALCGEARHTVTISDSPQGTITRMDNALMGIEGELAKARDNLEATESDLEKAKATVDLPFPKEDRLREAQAEVQQVYDQLGIGQKNDESQIIGGVEEDEAEDETTNPATRAVQTTVVEETDEEDELEPEP
jgi:hypothetical protein